MHGNRGRFLAVFTLIMASLACHPFTTQPSQGPAPADGASSVQDAAQALAAPETAAAGVRSLLLNLGVGVYTGSGQQVIPGSETGPEDFWLYESFLPALEALAADSRLIPFRELHADLAEAGYAGTESDLLALYRQTYAQHNDQFLPGLLSAMGVTFNVPPDLPPLAAWLLLLDSSVPPNGREQTQATGGGLSRIRPQAAGCSGIGGDGRPPGWGFAFGMAAFPQDPGFAAVNGPLLASSLIMNSDLGLSGFSAHERHPRDQGDGALRARASLRLNFSPVPVACGPLAMMPLTGPLGGALIQWRVSDPDLLQEHGSLTILDSQCSGGFEAGQRGGPWQPGLPGITDEVMGESCLAFTPRPEAAGGEGELHTRDILVEAVADPWPALAAKGLPNSFLPYISRQLPFQDGPQRFTVEWHEVAWKLTMTLELEDANSTGSYRWEGVFTPQWSHWPPQLTDAPLELVLDGEGLATFTIHAQDELCLDTTGDGGLREITLDISGSLDFEIAGEVKRYQGEIDRYGIIIEGEDPDLQTQVSDPECEVEDENLFSLFAAGIAQQPHLMVEEGEMVVMAEENETRFTFFTGTDELVVTLERASSGDG